MSVRTILVTLVLGASSAAIAHPIDVRDHRDDYTNQTQLAPPPAPPDVRDHRQDFAQPVDGDFDMYGWGRRSWWMRRPIMLANDVSITSDFRDHRAERPLYIDVASQRMARLRFDRSMGLTYIDSVVVMLPNGFSRTYSVRQWLSWRTPSITIDLDERAITGMYVYGSSMRGRGTFDVVGLRR